MKRGFLDLLDPSNDPDFFWQVISGPPCIFRYKKVRAPQAEHVFLLLQREKILFPRYLIISCFIKK
jgi:hypothetical protein